MSLAHDPAASRPTPPRPEGRRRRGLRELGQADDGSLMIFSIFVFTLMMALGGIGLDTMRVEAKRNALQATLDRAVLAAADLQQTRDPEAVVRDYFAKAGFPADLPKVEVVNTLNSRTVRASANIPVATTFLRIIGLDSFDAPASGSATEAVTDVEIGLVLDVSGSMSSNNRLSRLKTAGREFIDTMFKDIEPEHLSISLVPYSTQVNLGADLVSAAGIPTRHAYSYCMDIPAASYTTTRGSSGGFAQSGHFDVDGFNPYPRTSYNSSDAYDNMSADAPNCRDEANFEVLAWSNHSQTLKNRISALTAEGWTSIEMGVNWGTALLDPSARPVLRRMIERGQASPALGEWPRDYDNPEGMKVLVVMTDGANTYDFRIRSPYNTNAWSDVWLYGTDEYVVGIDRNTFFDAKDRKWLNSLPSGGTRLRWPDLFGRMTVRQQAYHLRVQQHESDQDRLEAWNKWTSIIEHEGVSTKDSRLSQICAAAREKNIVIFTIGFEIKADGAVEAMADCASSPAHFYRVDGLEIATAFTSIATQINALRLVQ